MFAAWMRLLNAVPGSALWLLVENSSTKATLLKEAFRHGVGPERLVFAPVRPLAEHLARYAAADLVLDTFPYTSHTTGSDALWAGRPMVTILGETFAARVGASLLIHAGLGELVARSIAEYEAIALDLARNADRLEALSRILQARRSTLPLFDSPRVTRGLEHAYRRMWARFVEGGPPYAFDVQDD